MKIVTFLVNPTSILDICVGPGCACQDPDDYTDCVGVDMP